MSAEPPWDARIRVRSRDVMSLRRTIAPGALLLAAGAGASHRSDAPIARARPSDAGSPEDGGASARARPTPETAQDPAQRDAAPPRDDGGAPRAFRAIAAGTFSTCAIATDGAVF